MHFFQSLKIGELVAARLIVDRNIIRFTRPCGMSIEMESPMPLDSDYGRMIVSHFILHQFVVHSSREFDAEIVLGLGIDNVDVRIDNRPRIVHDLDESNFKIISRRLDAAEHVRTYVVRVTPGLGARLVPVAA